MGGWVGPVVGLGAVENRRSLFSMQGIKSLFLSCSALSLVTIPTELSRHKVSVVT
jgi:hypothetical protein